MRKSFNRIKQVVKVVASICLTKIIAGNAVFYFWDLYIKA